MKTLTNIEKANGVKKLKMPTGIIFSELFHFMGGDDAYSINERSALAQQLVNKLSPGKVIKLSVNEHKQLIKELANAIDILKDHVYPGEEWNPLTQYHLVNFYKKVKSL